MAQKRLFVGIPIPEASRRSLAQIDLNRRGFRPVASQNLHLTLQFIGSVPATRAAEICESLASLQLQPFLLQVAKVGFFPSAKKPRILWAGLGQPPTALFQLQKTVEAALLALGIEREKRRWNPHITLARLRGASPEAIRQIARTYRDFSAPSFMVNQFALYRSELLPTGPTYTIEKAYDLQG